ncbi:MAG: response regulator [Candidatus Omnitrophica bacterium]|nr:response regulator [Candidatus Omnitrophota bacterium]
MSNGALQGKKIFIFEDDQHLATMLTQFLEMQGGIVKYVLRPREGMLIIEAFSPDVIITDINMPEIDGYSVFKEMQRKFPTVPIIAITGESKLKKLFEVEGIAAFLNKPFTMDELLATIKDVT